MIDHKKMIFIVGCPRSGTSILGEILRRSPGVTYLGEHGQDLWNLSGMPHATWSTSDDYGYLPDYMDHHERHPNMINDAVKEYIRSLLKKKIQEAIIRGDGKPENQIVLDKCPPNSLRLQFLSELFPFAKFVHIIRDGRDAACSLRPGLENDSWMFAKPKIWRSIMRITSNPLLRGTLLWKYIVREQINYEPMARGLSYMLCYENLIEKPVEMTANILRFLDIPDFGQTIWARDNVTNDPKIGHIPSSQLRWMQNDHAVRVGRHKENMTDEERELIEFLLREELEKFGYKEKGRA